MTITVYPCDRGTKLPAGPHHFQAVPGGTPCCIYCGAVTTTQSPPSEDGKARIRRAVVSTLVSRLGYSEEQAQSVADYIIGAL